MLYDPEKHKTIQHFNIAGHTHYLTFSCFDGLPLLLNDTWRMWLSKAINTALRRHHFQLTAFVYMPEHIHMIVWPRHGDYKIEDFLYTVKKPFSDRIKKDLIRTSDARLERLSLQEGGKTRFRFWQKGPGHDRNLFNQEKIVKAAEYIHNNPVRRGLCKSPEEWRWSSWNFYYSSAKWNDAAMPDVKGLPS
jgi:putative transposase